jgi:hypothetical protein
VTDAERTTALPYTLLAFFDMESLAVARHPMTLARYALATEISSRTDRDFTQNPRGSVSAVPARPLGGIARQRPPGEW